MDGGNPHPGSWLGLLASAGAATLATIAAGHAAARYGLHGAEEDLVRGVSGLVTYVTTCVPFVNGAIALARPAQRVYESIASGYARMPYELRNH